MKVLIIAGDISADLYAQQLAEALRARQPDIHIAGIGGSRLQSAGVELLFHLKQVTVVGLTEAISKLPRVWHILGELKRQLRTHRPDVLVLMDFPDFNFRIGPYAHELGIPVVYYISPQVWAWRPGRVRFMRRWVDRMLVIFPFETELYRQAGIPVEFVGHPLLEVIPEPDHRLESLRHAEPPTIALMPGSRESEVARILPSLAGAARLLQADFPQLHWLVPRSEAVPLELLTRHLEGLPYTISPGPDYPGRRGCRFALTAAGTATVENTILGLPMIIVYRISGLSYFLARCLVKTPHIGMVNILAGERLCPELLQAEATPEAIAHLARQWLTEPAALDQVRHRLAQVRQNLGGPGAAAKAAGAILQTARKATP